MRRETSKITTFMGMCTCLVLSSITNSEISMGIYLLFAIAYFARYIYLDRKSD